jgi:subtilisin family serine protease
MSRSRQRLVCLLLVLSWAACAGASPNDTYYPQSWHHDTLGSPAAWAICGGDASIVVAVIDTGVDAAHPDLAGQVIAGWNLYADSADTSPTHWHGTAVAGVIAAVRNNGRGVAGLADVSIMPVVVSPDETMTANQVSGGIQYALERGARVINVSTPVAHGTAFEEAVQQAWQEGAVVVVAAENSDTMVGHPQWPQVVLVSSSDRDDQRYQSGYGPGLDLLAPGMDIYTTYWDETDPAGEHYAKVWGASFAAAMVSGAAAEVWSVNPDLTPEQVRDILFATAVDLGTPGWDMFTGHGRLDMGAAAELARTIPEPSSLALLGAAAAGLLVRRRGAASRRGQP